METEPTAAPEVATDTAPASPPAPGGAALPALAAGVAIEPAPRDGAVRLALPLAVALMLHAAVLAAAVYRPASPLIGAGGMELEAIDIDLVTSELLEASPRPEPRAAAAAPAASVAPVAGAGETTAPQSAPSPAAQASPAPEQVSRPPPDIEAPPPEPSDAVADLRAAPAPAVPADPREAPQPEKDTPAPAQAASTPAEASDAAAAGGAVARGRMSFETGDAAAAASPGLSRAYGRQVFLALARSKPVGAAGETGTVRVAFVVLRDGGAADVRVIQSSGRQRIDAAALEAVRRARFPLPPAALADADLVYELPYHFR